MAASRYGASRERLLQYKSALIRRDPAAKESFKLPHPLQFPVGSSEY